MNVEPFHLYCCYHFVSTSLLIKKMADYWHKDKNRSLHQWWKIYCCVQWNCVMPQMQTGITAFRYNKIKFNEMQIRDRANLLKFPGMQNFCWKIIAIFFLVFVYIALLLHSLCWWERDHFETHFSLCFKASLSEKSLLWISVFIHIENRADYRNKTWDWLNKSTWNKGMILLKSKQNLKYFYIAFCFFLKIKYVTAFVCLFLVLCLQLISPSSERIFQAVTDQEVQEWVTAIQVFKISCDQLRIISAPGFIRYKNIIFSLFIDICM